MKFRLEEPQNDQNFILTYKEEDYSFDIEPLDGSGTSSIMVNELQLEIDHEGKVIYVWGFCPLIKFEETREEPKTYKSNSLVALSDHINTRKV